MANTFVKIATVTVGVLGSASIDFTSIPSTYTDLCLKISGRTIYVGVDNNFLIQFNSSGGTAYSQKVLYGTGSAASSFSRTAQPYVDLGYLNGSTSTSNTFGNAEIYIPNYAGSNKKSLSGDSVTENNATAADMALGAGLWDNTAAITSIKIQDYNSNNFAQYSTATLYGISKS